MRNSEPRANSLAYFPSQSIYEVEARTWHRIPEEAIIFAAFAFFYYLTAVPFNANNEHIRLAWALLHGHPYIDGMPVHEQVEFGGHIFILHPPLSAFVCVPFVAIWGLATSQVTILNLVGAVAVSLAYRLTKSWWLTVLFGIGSIFWYEASFGSPWAFPLVLSCVPTFCALINVREGRGGAWCGAWSGTAALARNELFLLIPVYALWKRDWKVLLGALPAFGIYVAFNWWRYGTWNDQSIWLWYAVDGFGKAMGHGPFSIHYLPYNLFTVLFMGPAFKGEFPWLIPQVTGQALVLTSPAFLMTLRKSCARETLFLWICVALALGPSLLVWSNGVEQFGWRYGIQAYPLLLMLMPKKEDRMTKILVVASVLIVTWSVCAIRLT